MNDALSYLRQHQLWISTSYLVKQLSPTHRRIGHDVAATLTFCCAAASWRIPIFRSEELSTYQNAVRVPNRLPSKDYIRYLLRCHWVGDWHYLEPQETINY